KQNILSFLTTVGNADSADKYQSLHKVDRCKPSITSYAQQRLWFLLESPGATEAYHIPMAFRLRGRVDEQAMRRALDLLVARHETLRTRFEECDGEVFQHVDPPTAGFRLSSHDLRAARDPQRSLQDLMVTEVGAVFDLRRESSIRGRLVRLAKE